MHFVKLELLWYQKKVQKNKISHASISSIYTLKSFKNILAKRIQQHTKRIIPSRKCWMVFLKTEHIATR